MLTQKITIKGVKVRGEIDQIYAHNAQTALVLPLNGSLVYAGGFSGMSEDWIEAEIDFNEQFIRHPNTTFYARIVSDSMEPEIHDGSFVIYDSSLEYTHGSLVVAVIDGGYVAKRYWRTPDGVELRSHNPAYAPIRITEGMECEIKGKIICTIREF